MSGLPDLISSRRNPLIRRIRSLHQSAGRKEMGLILLEGTHLLEECVHRDQVPELVLATPEWIHAHDRLVAALDVKTRLQPATAEVIASAATTLHPDGVVSILPMASLPAASSLTVNFVLALDRLQDPGNLGTLLRTALAAAIDQVWLGEGADPLQPKVLRASSGAALALPLERMPRSALEARVRTAQGQGMQVVASLPPRRAGEAPGQGGSDALPYWQVDWSLPTILLLGNEGAGLAPELADLADRRVTIPHSAAVESLNVAAAAAPLLLERWRRCHERVG
jgi:TrmH family RNA methyltransferase